MALEPGGPELKLLKPRNKNLSLFKFFSWAFVTAMKK
jgi:hypothetical protein